MLCKICGANIPDDAVECQFCGAKVGEEEFSDNSDTKVINTDEIIEESDSFDDVSDTEEETPEKEDDTVFDDNERRRREQMKKMVEDKKKQLSEIERRRNEKRQKQRRNRIMLIAAICALAIAAAGIGAYSVVQNVNSPSVPDATPMPTVSATFAVPTALPSVTATPSSELSMTTAPREAAANNSDSSSQSWQSTGNTGSGGNRTQSNSGSSSSGNSNTTSSNTGSSGNRGTSSSSNSGAVSSSGSSSSGSSAQVSDSGVSNNKITSQLSTGKEVIYNSGTGKYLMTFETGNTRYYANVSAGSTTEQIKNQPYTITAQPTSEKYNGNTVYEITSMTGYSAGDYILANSGTTLLTDKDIKGMSKYDLALARNEIYARHGRKFQTAEYNAYFTGKSWYSLNPNYNYSDDDSNLNDIEAKNVQFLLNAERR